MDIEKKVREAPELYSDELTPKSKEAEAPAKAMGAPTKSAGLSAKSPSNTLGSSAKDISDLEDDDDDEPPAKHAAPTSSKSADRISHIIALAVDVDRLDQEVRDHKAALGAKEERAVDLRGELEELIDN